MPRCVVKSILSQGRFIGGIVIATHADNEVGMSSRRPVDPRGSVES